MGHWFNPYSKIHGANMGPIWVLPAPGGPHIGPMNLAITEATDSSLVWDFMRSSNKTVLSDIKTGDSVFLQFSPTPHILINKK